ncbi:MAG TPA: HWE histidine kinase domain-containing protein [Geminicoccaceae bacterium]|nr:HWE histidine kinase domain-containing protein [Geminicoccaceae bacterium]
MFSFAPRAQGDGAFPVASPTIVETCGMAPEEVRDDVGPLFRRIEPADLAKLRGAIAQGTRDQSPWDVEFRYRHPSKGLLWMRTRCTPLVGEDGSLQWHGLINDITERKDIDEQLRRFAFLINNSRDFIGMSDLARRPLYVNQAGLEMVGLKDMTDARDRSIEDFFFPEDRPRIVEEFLPAVLREGHGTMEIRFRHFQTEEPVWMSYSVFTLEDEDDRPIGFATISQNIDGRKQDDERMELLIDELNHRVRNTLAIVNAIATQTMKHTPSVQEFRSAFGGRIAALAKTHTLLATKRWNASTLHELIVQQLEPYTRDRADAVDIAGPRLLVNPKQALTLSLVMHELAANAAKYGALSVPSGRVEIGWRIDPDRRLLLTWQETGGPSVAPPGQRGFGSQLIEFNIAHEFGGEAKLDYRPTGVECVLKIPLRGPRDEI